MPSSAVYKRQGEMTALCPADAKLCELAQFCRHGASFYPEVIRQFLTVEGDSEVIGTLQMCIRDSTKRFFLDFCDYSAPLAVDISENLYCGCQNLYHGSRGVGGDGNSCFIHL